MLQGTVTGDAMDKTITITVVRTFRHSKYGKFIRRRSKHYAHDESNTAHTGDWVEVMECRPLSRTKRWRLVRVISKSRAADPVSAEAEETLTGAGTDTGGDS